MTASPLAAHTHMHIPLRLTAPTKPQCILGTIKETRDHRSGQRTQTQGERRRAREIEIDERRRDKDVEDNHQTMEQTVLRVFAINKEGAEPTDKLEAVGIIIEGVEVLHDRGNVANALVILIGLMYTFEVLQNL
ncbi:hypothetical protein NFI96_027590%2C partial [Scomber scombrus]|uniref:Uncharacterized protein n=1 Tax=Scomber scombrus TaxID=13677 RepID=A0AAV1Q3P7_SCOSC